MNADNKIMVFLFLELLPMSVFTTAFFRMSWFMFNSGNGEDLFEGTIPLIKKNTLSIKTYFGIVF